MEKLELKHLAPYLPYGLNGKYQLQDVYKGYPYEIRDKVLTADSISFFLQYCKPILRTFSSLNIDNTEWKRNMYDMIAYHEGDFRTMFYTDVQELIENHYDIFGLIEKGLAIDINTLDTNEVNT